MEQELKWEGREREEGEMDLLAKTLYGLEDVLAEELRELGANEVVPGRRMVAFRGDPVSYTHLTLPTTERV